jgi:glycosyltransferase involved in cell wall biosynthesis
MKGHAQGRRAPAVLHVIVPQREGAIGGSDLHVLELAVAQQRHGEWHPLVLAPRATRDYLGRLSDAGVTVLPKLHFRALRELTATHNIGLIHGHGYEANYLIAATRCVSRRWASLPAVVTAHGWIETTPWLRVKSALDRLSMRTVDVRIASANAHVRQLRRVREPAVVIHNGVQKPGVTRLAEAKAAGDLFRKEHGIAPGHQLIGTVGRLSSEKRIDLFLAAGRQVLADRPDTHLVIVGGGAQRGDLERLARSLGIHAKLTFTGLLRDVFPALAALDILVQPSDTEGTPRSVLEAMATHVPVIATEVGDVAELLDYGRSGVLIPPGDLHMLAQAMIRLIESPEHARKLAERAQRRYEERYTIDVMRAHVDEIYRLALQISHVRSTSSS